MTHIPRPRNRIRLVAMPDDPHPIEVGATGTVVEIRRYGGKEPWPQFDVDWDNGRQLMLVSPPDRFEIVANERNQ